MDQYSFDQSEAETIIYSFDAVLHESGYAGPVVIDATDTDVYIAAAYIYISSASWYAVHSEEAGNYLVS